METIHDYLNKTDSATRKLFEGINSYHDNFRKATLEFALYPVVHPHEDSMPSDEYDKGKQAMDRFAYEQVAVDVLCGALLQIAAMGIQLFSKSHDVPKEFIEIIKPGKKPTWFCIGRPVRKVPIGLIIYAGRNQYNHFNDDELREPTKTIFERLMVADRNEGLVFKISDHPIYYKDPSFDLNKKEDITRFSSNIKDLLGWDAYEPFAKDMVEMVSASE